MSRKCFAPVSIPRPNGRGIKDRISVPCGKCAACDLNRIDDYVNRAVFEMRYSDNAFFITLTYDDKHLPIDKDSGLPTLLKSDYQAFLKRLRKKIKVDVDKYNARSKSVLKLRKMRYIFCGEYGPQNLRPHYHAVIFNFPNIPGKDHLVYVINTVTDCWRDSFHLPIGFVHAAAAEPGAINYVVSYILGKRKFNLPIQAPFFEASRKPGIGNIYVEKMKDYHGRTGDIMMNLGEGKRRKMPRYIDNKIFSAIERENNSVKKYNYGLQEEQRMFEERFDSDDVRYLGFEEFQRGRIEKLIEKKRKDKSKLPFKKR